MRYKNEIQCDAAIVYNMYIFIHFCINAYPYVHSKIDLMLLCPIQDLDLMTIPGETEYVQRPWLNMSV